MQSGMSLERVPPLVPSFELVERSVVLARNDIPTVGCARAKGRKANDRQNNIHMSTDARKAGDE